MLTRLCVWLFATLPYAAGQAQEFPVMGAHVPTYIARARNATSQCEKGTKRHDSCATVTIQGHRVAVGWNQQTKAINYLFTDDKRLIGDSELEVGGSCRVAAVHLTRYGQWFVAEEWKDRFSKWSGDAIWHAVLRVSTANPEYATIIGFVQNSDLKLH